MEVLAPKTVKTVQQTVEYAVDNYEVTDRGDPARLKFLRVSSFPFCGTNWLLNFPTAIVGKRHNKFMGSFFTSVGTSVHTSIQSVLDYSPFLIQDWKCFACGRLHTFVTRPECCTKCGSEALQGREHEYKDDILVGHLDGAIQLKVGIDILDYKTTSVSKINDKIKLPMLGNVRQIEAYSALKKQQGYDITGWTLIYISRDTGARRYCTSTDFYGHSFEEEYPRILKRIRRYKKDFVAVSTATCLEDVQPVIERRWTRPDKEDTSNFCEYCPYKSVCSNERRLNTRLEKSIKILVEKGLPK